MRRCVSGRSGFVPIVAGTMLIAGVAIAVVIGTARINSNQGETSQFAEPTVENIGVAVVDSVTACTDADLVYKSISSSSLFNGETFNYTPPGVLGGHHTSTLLSSFDLCLGNQATAPEVTVTVSAENVVSNELPGCPDPAEAAAGDTTCDPGQGELAGEVALNMTGPEASCRPPGSLWIEAGQSISLNGPIAPGAFCRYTSFQLVSQSFDAAPSTDTIMFDLVFTADDGT